MLECFGRCSVGSSKTSHIDSLMQVAAYDFIFCAFYVSLKACRKEFKVEVFFGSGELARSYETTNSDKLT